MSKNLKQFADLWENSKKYVICQHPAMIIRNSQLQKTYDKIASGPIYPGLILGKIASMTLKERVIVSQLRVQH